jgi:hypothetical protein
LLAGLNAAPNRVHSHTMGLSEDQPGKLRMTLVKICPKRREPQVGSCHGVNLEVNTKLTGIQDRSALTVFIRFRLGCCGNRSAMILSVAGRRCFRSWNRFRGVPWVHCVRGTGAGTGYPMIAGTTFSNATSNSCYGERPNLKFVQSGTFAIPTSWLGAPKIVWHPSKAAYAE